MWTILIIITCIILFVVWNTTLIGYRDKDVTPLEQDESTVFSEKAKSILLKQDSQKAILLLHGFPSTPSLYSYSAQRFFEAGWDVHVPLIPTFGSDPKEFEHTTFTQWFEYICRYYETMRETYPTVHVLGTSMGGLLALKLGETYCSTRQAPEKLVTIAAPVVYNSIRDGIITDYKSYIMRTVALFTPSIGAKTVDGNPNSDDGNEEWVGYGGQFVRCGLSLVHAMKAVRKNLGKITCPLFAIHDVNDKTVPFGNLGIIQRENGSKSFKSLETHMKAFKHNRHALLLYRSIQEELTDTIIEFLQSKERANG
ncbi:MAG: alpha/beta fold hydrolase [Sphaerochaeta sp.]|nr:alpha/beta fold hydrolase [Sphaerochaeta sp.]